MAKSHVPTSTRKRKGLGPTLIQESRSLGAEEKAMFHNLTGAGKSHVLRPFMDLNDDDQDHLTTQLAEGIDRLLAGER